MTDEQVREVGSEVPQSEADEDQEESETDALKEAQRKADEEGRELGSTGAERYLARRLKDPEYRAAYERATTRPEARR